MAKATPDTIHSERQPVPAWVYLMMAVLVLGVLTSVVWAVVLWPDAEPVVRTWLVITNAALLLLVAIFALLLGGIYVTVRSGHAEVRFGRCPFPVRVDLTRVRSCRAVTYTPMRVFGGWGLRRSPSGIRAYTARGNRGVLLMMSEGAPVLIGSDSPETLAEALGRAGVKVLPPQDGLEETEGAAHG